MPEFLVADEKVVRRSSAPLVVGAAHDPAEHEADAVADATLRRLAEQDAEAPGAPAHVHPVPAGRVHRSAHPGHAAHDEFEAPAEVDQRIRRATGRGKPLDADVRRRFEGATGRDLGNVRVHDGSEADQLNRAVSAKAFTRGNDIFFSGGSYQPGSRDGQHLLAHELAHTAQQSGSVQRTIRRFALDRPDFSATTGVTIFKGGGSGRVAQFDDGSTSPLIVKVDQMIGNEVSVAGSLHAATAAKSKGSKGYTVSTPNVRLATPQEMAAIKQQTLAKLPEDADPRNFVKNLDSKMPTVLMLKGSGQDFLDVIGEQQHTEKNDAGEDVAKSDSIIFQLINTPAPLTTIAQQLPVDVVMGMFDRVINLWNPQNFMYDPDTKTFGYVDNTMNRDEGFLTSVEGIVTSQAGFTRWAGNNFVKRLQSDPAALASDMYDCVIEGLRSDLPDQPGLADLFRAGVRKNGTKMRGWIKDGIKKGKTSTLAALANPMAHVASLPDPQRKAEALQSLIARRYVLKGLAPDKAWAKAGVDAAKLLPPQPIAPPRPDAPAPDDALQQQDQPTTPQQAPQQTTTWKPGVRWKSATPSRT